jgi:O-antigen ligase
LAVLLFGGQVGQRWIKWQLLGLVCGLLCYAVFVLLVPHLTNQPVSFLHRSEDIVSLSGREVIWTAAIGFFRENPWLGIGPMHFAYSANAVAAHPHNAVLQFMAEWGVPAAFLFTVVFAAGGLAFAKWVRRQTTAGTDAHAGLTAVALLAALAGAAAQAMVDGILVMPVSQTALVLICGWAMGSYFTVRSSVERRAALEKALGAAIIVLAAGSMVYGVLPEIGHIEQREDAYRATPLSSALLSPRFWGQGWINP